MNPAIIINAFNRPQSLSRLLHSLQAAHYPAGGEIPLVISLDDSFNHPEVAEVAGQFRWDCGPKEVMKRAALGLKAHFYACGDLVEKYSSIIYLEDDLLLSPDFYDFAAQALDYYTNDEHIGGISLYKLWFNGYNRQPFTPYLDGSDVFFLQLPYTQGEAFSATQWRGFRDWLAAPMSQRGNKLPIHESWSHFDRDEWFPEWVKYLVSSGRYFVFPRESLSTGMGEIGAHFENVSDFFQVPLRHGQQPFRLKPLQDSAAVYDSFFEMQPACLNRLTGLFKNYSYCVDLYANRTRANIPTEYVLTTRGCDQPLFSFAKTLQPMEANVVEAISGDGINFCKAGDIHRGWLSELITRESNQAYFSHGMAPSLRAWMRVKFAGLVKLFQARGMRFLRHFH